MSAAVPLIDASSELRVVVVEPDRDALRRSPSRCVAANAIGRQRGVLDVRVGARTARVRRKNGWHRYGLHPDTAAVIRAYDDSNEIMPAGFRVVLVPPAVPLGSRTGEKQGSGKRSGKGTSVATRRASTRSIFVEPSP